MKKTYGISIDDSGGYVMATMARSQRGWNVAKISRWESADRFRSLMLMHRGVYLSMPAHWESDRLAIEVDDRVRARENSPFSLVARSEMLDLHSRILDKNLQAVVPDDIFLATLPCAFGDPECATFVVVYRTDVCYKIGVVIDRELIAVFPMAPATPESLAGHMTRVRYYFTSIHPQKAFPAGLYLLNADNPFDTKEFIAHTLALPGDPAPWKQEAVLKAAGAALAGIVDVGAVRFSGPSPAAQVRAIRSGAIIVSAIMVLAVLVGSIGFGLYEFWMAGRIKTYQVRYEKVLGQNAGYQKLLAENKALAAKILRLQSTFSERTNWGRLLQTLGDIRPDGLYFDRLGSEPVKGSLDQVRLAFTGWAKNETAVTTFIQKLQSVPFITQLQLSGMGQDQEHKDVVRFRIYGTMAIRDSAKTEGQ
jgi:hypothetical protein